MERERERKGINIFVTYVGSLTKLDEFFCETKRLVGFHVTNKSKKKKKKMDEGSTET